MSDPSAAALIDLVGASGFLDPAAPPAGFVDLDALVRPNDQVACYAATTLIAEASTTALADGIRRQLARDPDAARAAALRHADSVHPDVVADHMWRELFRPDLTVDHVG